MKFGILFVLFAACVLLTAPAPIAAHHGSANYDMTKATSVKGVVKRFDFVNPHSAVYVEVKDDQGNTEQWLIECDSPNNLSRAGWTRESLKPGDAVTVVGNRLKNGSKVMRLQKIVFADGKELKPREGDEY
jgi:Family of unknown function (DUF6152)